ncbi:hypothetical protein COOONC_18886 [Cooperia oncophora]
MLSMSVMLLMLVGEMKFAMESVPGQRGSFSDVPLLGIYYMSLIFIISIATCTSSIFVHLEKYALRNPTWQAVPWCLQWLAAKKLFCCYVPKAFRYGKNDVVRNNNIQAISVQSSPEHALMKNLIPNEVNFTEVNTDAPLHGEVLLEAHRWCQREITYHRLTEGSDFDKADAAQRSTTAFVLGANYQTSGDDLLVHLPVSDRHQYYHVLVSRSVVLSVIRGLVSFSAPQYPTLGEKLVAVRAL